MKITKKMVHEDLRPHFTKLRIIPKILSRKWTVRSVNKAMNWKIKGKNIDGFKCDEVYIPSSEDDYQIRVRIYRPLKQEGRIPVLLYIHGGGYIIGNPEISNTLIERFMKTRPCVVISPDYTLALTKSYPAALNDCYDTMLWAKENNEQLNILADKFMVAGHSAGGGLTAAVTLKARDTKDVNIAFQMPIYPMIDDRQPYDDKRHILAPTWDSISNKFGWESYLSELLEKGEEIPAYAAPARNTDYRDFPPTISFVGTMEPFYNETLDYINALKKENIDVAFKAYDGCFHAFDITDITADTKIGNSALDFTFDSFGKFYDKYVV